MARLEMPRRLLLGPGPILSLAVAEGLAIACIVAGGVLLGSRSLG